MNGSSLSNITMYDVLPGITKRFVHYKTEAK